MKHLKLIGTILMIVGATLYIMGWVLYLLYLTVISTPDTYATYNFLAYISGISYEIGLFSFFPGLIIRGIAFSKSKVSNKSDNLDKRIEDERYTLKGKTRNW
jgi:hypothetical protein